jgi:hypothetical protein
MLSSTHVDRVVLLAARHVSERRADHCLERDRRALCRRQRCFFDQQRDAVYSPESRLCLVWR